MKHDASLDYLKKSTTKKSLKSLLAKRRNMSGFNTGTRTFKDRHDDLYKRRNWDALMREEREF